MYPEVCASNGSNIHSEIQSQTVQQYEHGAHHILWVQPVQTKLSSTKDLAFAAPPKYIYQGGVGVLCSRIADTTVGLALAFCLTTFSSRCLSWDPAVLTVSAGVTFRQCD